MNGDVLSLIDFTDFYQFALQKAAWLTLAVRQHPERIGGFSFPISQFMPATNNPPTLTVIIPAYNEAATIRTVIDRVVASPVDKEIIIVDDGSSDGTRDILTELSKAPSPNPQNRLRIFFQERNQGKGAAIRRAIPEATGRVTIIQDADLEVNPAEYPLVIQPILEGRADVVYGSRFHSGPHHVPGFWHYVGNKFLTLISNMFTGLNISDMETCYKTFRTEILQSIRLRSDGFGFEPEITAKIAKRHCRVYEVPISFEARGYAEGKKIGWRDAIQAVALIIKYHWVD